VAAGELILNANSIESDMKVHSNNIQNNITAGAGVMYGVSSLLIWATHSYAHHSIRVVQNGITDVKQGTYDLTKMLLKNENTEHQNTKTKAQQYISKYGKKRKEIRKLKKKETEDVDAINGLKKKEQENADEINSLKKKSEDLYKAAVINAGEIGDLIVFL